MHSHMMKKLALACGLVVMAAGTGTVGTVAAGPQSFLTLQPGFAQSLVAVTQLGTDADGFALVLGGIAFASNGDIWSAECVFSGTTLHRFSVSTTQPVTNGTATIHPEVLPAVATQGGCGLTNHPNGFLYANSSQGVWQLDASTGLPTTGPNPMGPAGNALGITTDPQTNHLVYAGADCHPTLVPGATTCTIWDFDPVAGISTPFVQTPHSVLPFVDGVYFDPTGSFLFVANRVDLEETQNYLTILSRPVGPVLVADTSQVVQSIPTVSEPDGVSFHATTPKFVVTNDESDDPTLAGTMTRFDFPGDDYTQPYTASTVTNFASGGFRGDLTQVGADGCIYATQGQWVDPTLPGTRYDDGTQTTEDSIVRICSAAGGGFAPPPGVSSSQPPPIALSCVLTSTGQVGVAYSSTLVATGGVAPYTFSIIGGLPAGLTLNAATGVISGTPTAAGPVTFTAQVVDATGKAAGTTTTSCPTITIAPAPPALSCVAASTGQVGVAYSSSLVATGGVGPYTYAITTGSLPTGLTLNASTGAITGTPTAAGSFPFVAQVIDARGTTAGTTTSTCGITIVPAPPALSCVAASTGQVGVAYSSSLVATGGVAPYTYSIASGSLPAGLSLNASTGAITGTPSAAGTSTFTAQVVDSRGTAAGTTTSSCPVITIAAAAPALSCVAATTGQVGVAYSSSLVATGGVGPYTYSIASGSLPAGLTLNGSTGAITGTPSAAGTSTFTAQVVDSRGTAAGTTTSSCPVITIAAAAPALSCVAASTGQVGIAYSSSLVATGGVAPYTYSIASGSLPAGLTLNSSTGAITGTPSAAGTSTFTAKVVDSRGTAAGTTTSSCPVITIAPPPISLACVLLSTGQVGVAYSSSLVATGGVAPYTFSIVGSLPAGLTLNGSTGAITGTPTAAGTSTFTAKVVDATGTAAGTTTSSCPVITIAPPPINLACVLLSTGQVGVAYSSSLMATGGVAPYTYSIASGSLPAGLTLNASTGAITGTPTAAGTSTFTAKVVDATGSAAGTTTSSCPVITIAAAAPALSCVAASTGQVGVAYSSSLVATGGVAPYTYSIASGSLPAGLTLNGSTGAITGTPSAAGTSTFTAKVVDSRGTAAGTTTSSCPVITIAAAAPALSCVAATTGQVGIAYSSSLVATGGVAPYTYSIASGSLPAGLTLNGSTGAITGTPSAAGTSTFTAKVVDSRGTAAGTTTSSCPVITIAPNPAACPSTTVPTVYVSGLITGPPVQALLTVQDTGSGIASIVVTVATNTTVTFKMPAKGYTGTVVVTATKINQNAGSTVGLKVTDVCGNVTSFDPVDVTVNPDKHETVTVTVAGDESLVQIVNDGLEAMRITVNGHQMDIRLTEHETRIVNIARAMVPGPNNKVVFEGWGRAGGHAVVTVYPPPPKSPQK
jgi:uncharacterized Ntn-hydrolase superfamily protein